MKWIDSVYISVIHWLNLYNPPSQVYFIPAYLKIAMRPEVMKGKTLVIAKVMRLPSIQFILELYFTIQKMDI